VDVDDPAMPLLYALRDGLALRGPRTGRPRPDLARAQGAALYMGYCSGCHQATGTGIAGVFSPLAGNAAIIAPDPGNILQAVLLGVPAQFNNGAIPSFAAQLNDQQIADIANYVRSSWGNTAPPNATAATVAQLRAQAQPAGPNP
jgi:mono/diheme cytochrome c family protein